MKKNFFRSFVLIIIILFGFNSCSIKKLALNKAADMLSSSGSSTVFTGDNDPELVGDALPFAIKFYESLLEAIPSHRGLQLTTGSLYIMYANAFLQTPADMLTDDEYKEQEFLLKRAKNLYLRGRDIILNAIDRKYPGFTEKLNEKKYDQALKPVKKKDVPFLYWAGAGWVGAFAIDPFDMKLGLTLPRAAAMMDRVLEMDENFRDGAIHDFYILYYGSLPEYMGGSLKKARYHFEKSIVYAKGKSTSPYMSLATTVTVKEQNSREFSKLLKEVLKFDPDSSPENRLSNILNQRKARWLLEHIEDFFITLDDDIKQDKNEKVEKE